MSIYTDIQIYIGILLQMTSCLEVTACPSKKRIYNIPCRFSAGMNVYVCNVNTCTNVDGRHDCCAYNIADCLVLESSLYLPTVQPSMAIIESGCNSRGCQTKYRVDKCYWYETINSNIMCCEDGNEYCCSQDRADCCQTNKTAAIVTISCVASVILLLVWYRYFMSSYSKVMPIKLETAIEPSDKYQLSITRENPNSV